MLTINNNIKNYVLLNQRFMMQKINTIFRSFDAAKNHTYSQSRLFFYLADLDVDKTQFEVN